MAACRAGDPAAGAADPRMGAYLEGRHHPQQALPPRVAYMALAGEAVVGYIAGHLTRRFEYDGEVQYLYVAPDHRRRGVGAALLRLLLDWFVARGAARVCVNVDLDSPPAAAFYVSQGAHALNPHWYAWEHLGRARRAPGEPGPLSST